MKAWVRQSSAGDPAAAGHPIIVWCNSATCTYRKEHGKPCRAVLTVADLEHHAERYGPDVTFVEFRKRLRCRHCGSGDISTIVDAPYVTPGEREARRFDVQRL